MRAHSVLIVFGLLLTTLLGLQLLALTATAPTIDADVNIVPDVFNLKRRDGQRGVITAYVGNLTKNSVSYDVRDINLSTIRLYYEGDLVAEALRVMIEDNTVIAKFDANTVANYIWFNIAYHMGNIPPQANKTITLTVGGQLISNGETFAGSDTIKIISP